MFLLSASGAGEGERARALQAGAVDFLVKPVTSSTLVDSLLKAFAPEVLSAMKDAPKESNEARELLGARVLLVEDNEINQQIALELMKGAGINASLARNGREAYEILERTDTRFDLVLMDIQMPEIDGYEATKRIRSQTWGSEIPIIAMTAHALVEEREKAMQAGMNDHISKPIDPDAMFATMQKYYRHGGSSATTGQGRPRPRPRTKLRSHPSKGSMSPRGWRGWPEIAASMSICFAGLPMARRGLPGRSPKLWMGMIASLLSGSRTL